MAEITRKQMTQRVSRIVIHGDTIYLAGHTAPDSSADVAGETRQVLELIESRPAEAGQTNTTSFSPRSGLPIPRTSTR